jgi:hypothetical protein
MPEIVSLRVWYPAMHDKWQQRLADLARQGVKTVYPLTERVGWVIHHTVGGTNQSPLAYARGVADMHWKSWLRPGGYNFLVGEDGRVREMCGYTHLGAHAGTNEWNRKTLGLSFQGDFRTRPPSDVMLEAGAEFIADTPIPEDQWTHRAVRPTPTTCPGDAFIRLLPLEAEDMTPEQIMDALGIKPWHLNTLRAVHAAADANKVDVEAIFTALLAWAKAKSFPGAGSGGSDTVARAEASRAHARLDGIRIPG